MTDEIYSPGSDEVTGKEPCPRCREDGGDSSGDNLVRYADGHAYCYACDYRESGSGEGTGNAGGNRKPPDFERMDFDTSRGLGKRGISPQTCRKFGYGLGRDFNDNLIHVCDVRTEEGNLVAQKIRTKDKDFWINGSISTRPLIGMHLWNGGRKLVITEGEIDMLSYAELTNCRYAVVSLPNGAASAKKAIAANLNYLAKFEEVVLMFDMDEAGREAAKLAADLAMSVTNVKIASLPLKDANDCLMNGESEAVVKAVFNAAPHQPDGLIDVDEVIKRALQPKEPGLLWMFEGMNASSNGRKYGEVHTIGAGTGVGKTDLLCQQMDYDVRVLGLSVGAFFVETDPEEVLEFMAGKADEKLYYEENHPHYELVEQKAQAMSRYRDKLFLYDNFGLCDWDSIKSKILYLITKGFRVFYVDHLTALATGGEKQEKEELEHMMADIAELAKRHKALIHVVSHLTTPEGKTHEEGGRVTIRQFKGSRAIGFWSHAMYGLERNQQAEGDDRFVTTIRQLKRRRFGKGVGMTTKATYDPETGVLREGETHGFSDETEEQF